jgi:hypothetical protein
VCLGSRCRECEDEGLEDEWGDIVRGKGDGADPERSGGVIGPLGVGGSSSSLSIAAAENVALCCL